MTNGPSNAVHNAQEIARPVQQMIRLRDITFWLLSSTLQIRAPLRSLNDQYISKNRNTQLTVLQYALKFQTCS